MNIKRFSLCLLLCPAAGDDVCLCELRRGGGGCPPTRTSIRLHRVELQRAAALARCDLRNTSGRRAVAPTIPLWAASAPAAGYGSGAEEPDPGDPDPTPDPVQDVKRIRVKTSPTKRLYLVGDTFDPGGRRAYGHL